MSKVAHNDGASKPAFSGEKVRLGDTIAVKDVFDLQMGKTPSRDIPDYWNNGEFDWVSIRDLGCYSKYVERTKETISSLGIEKSKIKPVPANTLIMSFKLSLGRTAITKKAVFTNEAIMAFLDKGSYPVNLDYMYHQFRSKDWTTGTNTAVMGKTLNKKTLGSSLIRVPDIDTQRRIGALMDCVYNRIEQVELCISHLQTLVKSRFIEMFGDPGTNNLRWMKAPLGTECKIITGNTPSRKCLDNYGDFLEWVKTDNIDAFGNINPSSEHLSAKGAEKARIVDAGAILMTCIAGSVKSIGRVGLTDRRVAFNQQINAIVPGTNYLPEYLLWAFKLSKDYLCCEINMQLKGILNKTALSAKEYALPPLPLQREFAGFAERAAKLEFVAQRQIEKLQMLYDSLAQEYFG